MSTKRRARRPAASAGAPSGAAPASTRAVPAQAPARPALPEYHWRTFPVYFAFALGMFIGLEAGLVAGWLESTVLTTVFSSVVAVFLGFGIARFVVVWMMRHNWVKPRPKRRR